MDMTSCLFHLRHADLKPFQTQAETNHKSDTRQKLRKESNWIGTWWWTKKNFCNNSITFPCGIVFIWKRISVKWGSGISLSPQTLNRNPLKCVKVNAQERKITKTIKKNRMERKRLTHKVFTLINSFLSTLFSRGLMTRENFTVWRIRPSLLILAYYCSCRKYEPL